MSKNDKDLDLDVSLADLGQADDASYKRGKWTKEEDETLRQVVQLLGERKWKKIAHYVPGRSPIQCLHRWNKILKPGLVKGPWTAEEDNKLLEWIKREGARKWSQCAKLIPGRSGKQCRERWMNNLNPDIKRGNWSEAEDELLFKLYTKYGTSWSKIAKNFQGRTENCIKNRFYSTMRKVKSSRAPANNAANGGDSANNAADQSNKQLNDDDSDDKDDDEDNDSMEGGSDKDDTSKNLSTKDKEKDSLLFKMIQQLEKPKTVGNSSDKMDNAGDIVAVGQRAKSAESIDFDASPKKRMCLDVSKNAVNKLITTEGGPHQGNRRDTEMMVPSIEHNSGINLHLDPSKMMPFPDFAQNVMKNSSLEIPGMMREMMPGPSASTMSNIEKMKAQIQEYCDKFINSTRREAAAANNMTNAADSVPVIGSLIGKLGQNPATGGNAANTGAGSKEMEEEGLQVISMLKQHFNSSEVVNETLSQCSDATSPESKKQRLLVLVRHILLLETLLKTTKKEILTIDKKPTDNGTNTLIPGIGGMSQQQQPGMLQGPQMAAQAPPPILLDSGNAAGLAGKSLGSLGFSGLNGNQAVIPNVAPGLPNPMAAHTLLQQIKNEGGSVFDLLSIFSKRNF